MEKVDTFINMDSIKEFLQENSDNYSDELLQAFVAHLETDFYDWLASNLKYFSPEEEASNSL